MWRFCLLLTTNNTLSCLPYTRIWGVADFYGLGPGFVLGKRNERCIRAERGGGQHTEGHLRWPLWPRARGNRSSTSGIWLGIRRGGLSEATTPSTWWGLWMTYCWGSFCTSNLSARGNVVVLYITDRFPPFGSDLLKWLRMVRSQSYGNVGHLECSDNWERKQKSSLCRAQMVKDQRDLADSHSRHIWKSLELTLLQVVLSITFPLCSVIGAQVLYGLLNVYSDLPLQLFAVVYVAFCAASISLRSAVHRRVQLGVDGFLCGLHGSGRRTVDVLLWQRGAQAPHAADAPRGPRMVLLCPPSSLPGFAAPLHGLELRERHYVGSLGSMPDCAAPRRVVVVEAATLGVKQLPPLVAVGLADRNARRRIPAAFACG